MKINKGYTLVEVIVTLSIFIFMLSITLPQEGSGYTKIKFNSYIHALMINIHEFQVFGSSAGQVGNTRILAAGFNFSQANGVNPYYDSITNAATAPTSISDLRYNNAERANSVRLDYSNNIIVDSVCYRFKYDQGGGASIYRWSCNNVGDFDLLFIRPSTRAMLYLNDTPARIAEVRDITNDRKGMVIVRFRYLGINDFKCLAFSQVYTVYEPTQALCDTITDPANRPPNGINPSEPEVLNNKL